ncbi:MAG TPA: gluconokinase, partial [Candidatus Methylomirabilis sp.]
MGSVKGNVLAIDIGTSATKGVIFDPGGRVLAIARQSYPMLTPRPDWAEQDPDVVLRAVLETLRTAYQQRPPGAEIAAISFSSQWYSTMPVDKDGRPLANYLTWSDRRAADVADRLRLSGSAQAIYQATGCPVDAIYPLSKIAWFQQGEVGRTATRYISIKEYVFHHLFGEYAVDWGMAAATGLLDIRKAVWDETAVAAAGIRMEQLSPLVSPRTILTHWNPDVLAYTRIPQGTPCVFGGGDGALASVGVGAIGKGVAAVNVGTSAAARYLTQTPLTDPRGRLWTYLVDEGWWVVGGIVSSGAVVYDWFTRAVGPGEPASDAAAPASRDLHAAINDMAGAISPGAEGLIFLPYLSGEQCPVWDPRTTGGFWGLTLRHGRAHLARAVYEGITMSIVRIVEAIGQTFEPIEELRVTGGLLGSSTWLRIAADMFGARIHVPETAEGSALGAAVMAWVALGMAPDLAAAKALARPSTSVEPNPETHRFYHEHLKRADRIL